MPLQFYKSKLKSVYQKIIFLSFKFIFNMIFSNLIDLFIFWYIITFVVHSVSVDCRESWIRLFFWSYLSQGLPSLSLMDIWGLPFLEPPFSAIHRLEPRCRKFQLILKWNLSFSNNNTITLTNRFWWDHTGVWCGNVHQDLNNSQCGRCGDAPGNTHANQGGRYDKAIITATYQAGSVHTKFDK